MPADPPDSLSSALTRNIRTLEERRARETAATTRQEKVATFSNFSSLSDDDAISLLALQELSEIHAEQHSTFISLRNLSRVLYGAAFLSMIPDLAEIDFMPRDATPTLPECYIRLDRGELDPRIAPGQALIGAALLRQAPM
jgi:hypothetical protein